MTNQLQGEVLFKGWDGSNGEWCYTPWMPVRGDVGTFGVEVLSRVGVTLTWNVETRTAENPASVAPLFTNQTTSALGVVTVTSSPSEKALQWVRYRFATGGSATTSDYVVVRAIQPSWQQDR